MAAHSHLREKHHKRLRSMYARNSPVKRAEKTTRVVEDSSLVADEVDVFERPTKSIEVSSPVADEVGVSEKPKRKSGKPLFKRDSHSG